MSGKVLDVVGLLATVTLVVAVTACGGDGSTAGSEEDARSEARVAEDAEVGVHFELSGKRLRVVVGEELEETRQLLTGRVDVDWPALRAAGRLPAGAGPASRGVRPPPSTACGAHVADADP